MTKAVCIGPFPVLLPPPNARHGRKVFDGGSLVSQQRAMVRAAMSGRCSVCGTPRRAVRLPPRKWSAAVYTYGCLGHAGRPVPYQLPPHGPEHSVDVHIVRVPKHRGRALDVHENLPFACKPIVDEVTLQLWPKGPGGKPVSKPDDSAPWLRFSYGHRPHRKFRQCLRSDGPIPDPPNKGTELCEIRIAPREDCQCYCGELRQAARQWRDDRRRSGILLRSEELLLRTLERLGDEPCGCGRSMLPVRWERGL